MALTTGTFVGSYEIVAPIGAGGMGEVYRARDTKLKREVALKVLPESFADDAERLARFQREAEVLASLNHPNIAHIYAVENRALAMELVEGESPQGPLPFDEAWKIASQIADALDYAHERGIVHRDLKPANLRVTADGVVKLLDFGLAKAYAGPEAVSANPENSPTLTLGATQLGVILGTAGYMAPEQAKGKVVDKRADIWSFGVVLYELLTGERLFHGEDVSETLAQVLTKEPDLTRAPAAVRKLLHRCLEKDPKKRLRDIGEARYLIESGTESPARAGSLPHMRLVWPTMAALFAGTLAALSFIHFREKGSAEEVVRFQIFPRDKQVFSGAYVSPNGRWIVFPVLRQSGGFALWILALNSLDARLLAGTEGVTTASPPVWSPDSRFIAFAASGKLKKVEVSGGSPRTVCDFSGFWEGGAWTRTPSGEGIILFGTQGHGLMRVPEAGGSPSPVTLLDSSHAELDHSGPAFLPDGRHFLFRRNSSDPGRRGIYLGSLDSKPAQQGVKRLIATSSFPAFALASTGDAGLGYILFVRESSLMAQPFDSRRLELTGEAAPIAGDFAASPASQFSVSATGVLAYQVGGGSRSPMTRLTWYDRTGKVVGSLGEPGQYNSVAVSPDGSRTAFMLTDPHAAGVEGTTGNSDIWVRDVARGIFTTRLTFDPLTDAMAVWSPDGSRIVFASNRDGFFNLYQKLSSGAGSEEPLLKSGEAKYPYDWSQDGHFLLYGQSGPKGLDLWFLPLMGDNRKPTSYLATEANESQARFSPDGRYVAYTSNVSGTNEVYVRPFPDANSGLWQISTGGGNQPHWRRDGQELFYISVDSKVMAVPVSLSRVFHSDVPKALFSAPIWGGGTGLNITRWDVTGDGKKFLINTLQSDTDSAPPSPVTVVLNWQKDLRK